KGKYIQDALFHLAGLYHTNNSVDQEVALNFLNRLLNEFPESSHIYQSYLQRGDILYKQDKFTDARESYLTAFELAQKRERKLYPKMQSIICLYRSDQVAKADEEMKQFDRAFDDIDEYLGQIEVAKGDYYFDRKYFQTAEETYKSARSKFKKTQFGPLAELKLGKLYLTLNKDEEALEILTEMPEKYEGNKVIPEVYIALGEFYYFKARQPEHAMLAFKNAIEQPNIEEPVLSKGMSYLIKTYFDLGMLDQALTLSRKYVDRFPLEENTFDIRIQIGIIYNKLNEYDRAIDYLRKLKREADEESEPRIQYWIADCYFEQGFFEQAIIEYLKVRYLSKPTKLNWAVTAQYKAGLAYMKLDKNDEAKQLFRKIIAEQGAESPFGKGAQKKIYEIEQK
ncbi:tetratricopeptide repeat protein, partial [candidate division KSB1 bacterium]|nr:tetratricopeptide repeat protein [candidate division KSB1 bacterium]